MTTLADKLQPVVNQVAIQIKTKYPQMDDKEVGRLAKQVVIEMTKAAAEATMA